MRDVSIIVPVYNGEKTIAACLDSLLRQKLDAFSVEVVVIDDGSSDRTEDICRAYESRWPELIRYFRKEKNVGVSAARNLGLSVHSGSYVGFVDCDDTVAEDYLLCLLQGMSEDVDLVCCGYEAIIDGRSFRQGFFEQSCVLSTETEKEEFFLRLLNDDYGQPGGQKRVTAVGVPWGKLFRSSIIRKNELRFPEKLRRSEDNLFVSYYAALCGAIRYVDLPLYRYNVAHSRDIYNRFLPEDYRAILAERDRFFAVAGISETSRLNAFRCAEKAVMLNSAIKNIVLHHPRSDALQKIRALADCPEFRFPAEKISKKELTDKQRIYLFLYGLFRRGRYGLLDTIWRQFYRLR